MTEEESLEGQEARGRLPLRVGDLVYRPATGEVVDGTSVRRLRPQAADAFAALLERPGELAGRAALIDRLWPHGAVEGDLGLNACIRQIRRALGDEAGEPRYIETLRGRGYRLIAPVAPAGADGSPSRRAVLPAVSAPDSRGGRRLRMGVGLGALLVACVGFGLAWARLGSESPAVPAPPYRLAVFPVGSLGDEDGLELSRAALTEDLVTALANGDPERLAVVGRRSVETLVARGLDATGVARALALDFVLTGTLRDTGSGRRLTVQLLDASDGTYAWSRGLDLERGGGAAHREVAGGVLAALGLEDGGADGAATLPEPLRTALLQARYLRDRFTVADSRRAVDLLTEAMGPDSAEPALLVELAHHRTILGELDAADRALDRARTLSADAPGVDHAAGRVALYGRLDIEAALAALERAVRRQPGLAEPRHDYAHALAAAGRREEAAGQARKALALDPVSSVVLGDMGWVLYYAGDPHGAREACRETLVLREGSLPGRKCVVLAAAQEGELDQVATDVGILAGALGADGASRARLEEAARTGAGERVWSWLVELDGGLEPVDRARALALLGRTDEARATVRGLPRDSFGALLALQDPLFRGS